MTGVSAMPPGQPGPPVAGDRPGVAPAGQAARSDESPAGSPAREPAAVPPPRRKRRGFETAADMVRSLGLLLAVVLVVVWLQQRPAGDPVRVVDAEQTFRLAEQRADYPVRTPQGLGSGWRPTSSRATGEGESLTVEAGYVTPAGQFARFASADRPAAELVASELGESRRPVGTVDFGGEQWQRYRGVREEEAYVRAESGVSLLVTGTASTEELRTLARSLR